jgi:hypothetical protein
MRSDRRPSRGLAALAATGLMTLAVACTGGPARVTGPAGGGHTAGAPPRAAAAGTRLPAAATAHGALSARGADLAYSAVIVPAYPLAVQLADALVYHPSLVPARASALTASLSRSLTSLAGVSAFPPGAQAAFASYRSQERSLLASLARPAAMTASMPARRQAALRLYTLAEQIGDLGTDLALVPATESGGRH